jgi:hypothetical protein
MVGLIVLAMVQWGFLTGVIANSKNRDAAKWFALGAVLPVIGLALAIGASTLPKHVEKPRVATKAPVRIPRLRPAATSV